MKKSILAAFMINLGLIVHAQTLNYSNFSVSLANPLPVNVANNSSFSSSLTSTTGSGVTWDASALSLMGGYPTLQLSFLNPSTTPNASLYPSANYCEYDPALTAVLSYMYYGISADSLVEWGSYDPDTKHEIFQDPDKHLIFPFSYGQTFTDNYSKTNYSDATTISSFQNGTRTVTFNGYGTLILPQGTFLNVALISESRTNNLGPVSYQYTWYDMNNGKKLLFRSENGTSITTAWCADPATAIFETENENQFSIFPNPASSHFMLELNDPALIDQSQIKVYNSSGAQVLNFSVGKNKIEINRNDLPAGIYFVQLITKNNVSFSKKIILQ